MHLIRLLFKTSWVSVTIAGMAALLSGGCSAGLIALVNLTLKGTTLAGGFLLWSFVAMCLVLFISTALSQILTSRIAQQVVVDLRLLLTHRILACPLPHLEKIGAARLLATLTEDVEVVASASFFISVFGVNVALLVGCLLYLGWLSGRASILCWIDKVEE
jgi:putative pyoverdin transport system ATP-binding/permease protein